MNNKSVNTILENGALVLQHEIDALLELKQCLNSSFSQTVEYLVNTTGRIILSGVGKSGHIARKIAATFASTGTPAYYVHPTEAAHGDLGMILSDDILLIISNSGNTVELTALLNYAIKKGIMIIAITQNIDSTLSELADVCLLLPKVLEACPLGCAPTSSTTCTLALGDALAIAALQLRGFNTHDFNVYHPGGTLGKQLSNITEIMHTGDSLPLVGEHDFMSDVIVEMTMKCLGCAGVINANGELIGIITDGDLRRNISDDLMIKKAYEIMNLKPITIDVKYLVSKAEHLMRSKHISTCFVLNDKKPVGLVHIHNFK